MIDYLQQARNDQHDHQVLEKVEVGRNASSEVFEVFSDISPKPVCDLLLFSIAAGASQSVRFVHSCLVAVVVKFGFCDVGWPCEGVIWCFGHCSLFLI